MATLLISLVVLAIVSDFLLELFSVRMSQSTGRLQVWFFEHFGHNIFLDFCMSVFYQILGFRKKAFFLQLSSLINVGSFSAKQCLILVLGSFAGWGLSLMLFYPSSIIFGGVLCAISFVLGLFWKDQIRDLGVALLAWGLLLIIFSLFNSFLSVSLLNLHNIQVHAPTLVVLIILSSLLFRTPLPFLICVASVHHFMNIGLIWFPLLFFVYQVISLLPFYSQILYKRQRLHQTLITTFVIQLLQLFFGLVICWTFASPLSSMVRVESFSEALQVVLLSFLLVSTVVVILFMPMVFLITLLPLYNPSEEKKLGAQKIINTDKRGQCFSIHLSLFLLRQEFKKFTTSVHTIFKLSREADSGEEEVNQRFVRYQAMLVRVGDELKELCFSIGRQRSYGWQVKEVMSYYKIVNQLELLVDDLGMVTAALRQENLDEDWEKECRYWLGLQLKIFESFFHYTLGVGKDDAQKVQSHIDKSYEILDRFFANRKGLGAAQVSSQTFYRITDSIGSLAL
jgi:hypothetical protein